MTKDYKRQNRSKSGAQKTTASPWKFMLAGFGLGLIAAFALYLKLTPSIREASTPIPDVSSTPMSTAESDAETQGEAHQTVAVKTRKSTRSLPPQGEPDLEFYDMLREFEVVVSDGDNASDSAGGTGNELSNNTARSSNSPTSDTSVNQPGTYILQAGSFKSFTDADRRKAELAFKGIESNIQQVVLDKDQTWYRVYVGPTSNLGRLEKHRSLLRRDNIDVLMLKVKP